MNIDWQKALRDLAEKRGWSMRQLAGDMGVSPQYLHKVLHGERQISPLMKIQVAGKLGWNKTSDLLYELLPGDVADAWKEWDDRTTKELGEKSEKKLEKRERKKKDAAE